MTHMTADPQDVLINELFTVVTGIAKTQSTMQRCLVATQSTLQEFKTEVDQRLDKVDERFDGVDQRFDGVDGRFDGIEGTLVTILERLPVREP